MKIKINNPFSKKKAEKETMKTLQWIQDNRQVVHKGAYPLKKEKQMTRDASTMSSLVKKYLF